MPLTNTSASFSQTFVHIPTPGDHYSPATGSAIPTIIYEISRWHDRAGGTTHILVGKGTRHDYPIGECVEVDFTAPPGKPQKAMDAILGKLGVGRPFGAAAYRPASKAIPQHFDGPIFLHNSPVALPLLKREHPGARACLWANNQLFRTYSDREVENVAATADMLICCSEFIANDLRTRLKAHQGKVRIVHNGADIERFQPFSGSIPGEIPTVLFLGRVTPVKGPDLLLKAAVRIRDRKRKFKVRIVGSSNFNAHDPLTPYEQELRKLAAPLGEAVEFQPFVDRHQVLNEYRRASIFCAPSNWDDPCPLIVPEAMACGLPVITSRRGGIPEVGKDAVLYFQPPDTEKLADHLAYLIDSAEARDEWGCRARACAEQSSWERRYQALLSALSDGF